MKLLVITHDLGTSGAAGVLVDALLVALQRGWQIDALCPPQQSHAAQLQSAGLRFITNARAADYDLAVVNTLLDVGRVLESSPHVPVLFWVHEGLTLIVEGHPSLPLWSAAFRASSRILFQTAWQPQAVFAPFLTGVHPRRVAVVPSGPSQVMRQALLAAPLPRTASGPPRLLWIGSVYPRKRPQDFVQAVLQLADLGVQADIVGSTAHIGLLDDATRSLLAARPDVFTLHGELTDIGARLALMQRASAWCLPSGDETFGIANMEAALAGLPLALSALPCYQGIWQHGVNALLHPTGAVDALAHNLRALLTDAPLAARLAQAGRETALGFARQDTSGQILSVLEAAAGDPA